MSAADYTDGGGWAKLDQRSADMLAEAVGLFRKSERVERTRMLLTLFRCIASNGTFAVSEKDLAEKARTTVDKASGLFEALEKADVIVRTNSKLKDGTIVRRFSWHNGENHGVSTGGNGENPGVSTGGSSRKPGKSPDIKRVQSTQKGALCAPTGSGSAKRPTRPGARPNETALNPDLMKVPPPYFASSEGGGSDG